MKTNKVTAIPRLRFPEFDGDWKIFYLNNVSHNLDSKRVPITSKDRKKGNIPYYGASGIIDYIDEFIFDDNLLCISEDGANLIDRVYPIAFSVTGKTWINNHAHVLKFENLWTQVIVESYLNHISLEKYLTGVAQPKLNKAKLNSIEIPLPKLKEQKKIADCLSSLDDLINAENEQLDALQEYKAGLLQQLFPVEGETTPKLRFAEFKDDGDWSTYKLNKIAKLNKERNKNERVTRVFTNSAINGIVDQQDYFKKDIANKSNLGNYYIVNKNDFIYNPRISVNAPVGPISRNKIGAGVMSPLYTVFSFTKGVSSFYEYYFQTTYWHQYLKQVSNMGARHDRMNVSVDDFKKIPLPYPNVIEQQKIADCLSSLDNLIKLQDNKVEALKQHKQGLMQQLFPTMDGE